MLCSITSIQLERKQQSPLDKDSMNMFHIDGDVHDMLTGKLKYIILSETCVPLGEHLGEHLYVNRTAPESVHQPAVYPQNPATDFPPQIMDDAELGHPQ